MSESEEQMFGEGVCVLVVDDEPAICKALTTALMRVGYHVLVAQSGDSALATLASERVDVMVLDFRIPDTRGDVVFELAAASHPHLRHQTLFITGDLSERAQKLIDSCHCPVIQKPFELKELIAAVGNLARARDARDQSA